MKRDKKSGSACANPTGANVDTMIVQFSSSISGDVFLAAPGSTLDVKDIEFVYE